MVVAVICMHIHVHIYVCMNTLNTLLYIAILGASVNARPGSQKYQTSVPMAVSQVYGVYGLLCSHVCMSVCMSVYDSML